MGDRRAPDWLTRTTYAHRGLHAPADEGGVPENSLAAARAAIARGLGIECDIQRSRDDWPMVFHDWDLARLTGSDGLTDGLTADELEALPLRGTDHAPVRLSRFLEVVGGRVPILIEIKSQPGYDVERTCAAVDRDLAQYPGPAAVMSFDPRVCDWFADHAPQICRGLVGTDSLLNGFENVWRKTDIIERGRPGCIQPDFLAIDRRDLGQPEAARWRAEGKPLLSWTIRTTAEWSSAKTMADALIAEGDALIAKGDVRS